MALHARWQEVNQRLTTLNQDGFALNTVIDHLRKEWRSLEAERKELQRILDDHAHRLKDLKQRR